MTSARARLDELTERVTPLDTSLDTMQMNVHTSPDETHQSQECFRHKTCKLSEELDQFLGSRDHSLNQFWYSPATIATFTDAICHVAGGEHQRIAFLSTPSLFFAMPDDVRRRSVLLEYDQRWAVHEQFRFFDFNEGVGEVQGTADLLSSITLCVVDPPFIDKRVWSKYLHAADCMLHSEGHVLLTSIPENQSMLCAEWDKLNRPRQLRGHRFTPINSDCLHRFAVFTTFDSLSLGAVNLEPEPEGQGLGQSLAVEGDSSHAGLGAADLVDSDDEVDGMFGGLQAAVISMHMDMNDSEHESESDVEDEVDYEFCKKTRRVQRKQPQ